MRRKDKRIKAKSEMELIMEQAMVCRMGLSIEDVPYVVPLNFGYKDNCIYCHSAKKGRKMDILQENNSVCVEFDIDFELEKKAHLCDWNTKYRSVICFGKANLIEDLDEKRKALDVIVKHYADDPSYEYPERALKDVAIIKVKIDKMTGKRSGY